MTLSTLRTSKWILRTVLALLFLAFCILLAFWQWQRSQDELAIDRAALAEPVPVEQAWNPMDPTIPLQSLGRQVLVTGELLPGAQTLVRDRTSDDGRAGYWVVAGVSTDEGNLVPVLLGWTGDSELPNLSGPVEAMGRLQPDENFYPEANVTVGEPILTITKAGLTQIWSGQVADGGAVTPGFVAAISLVPSPPTLELVTPLIGTDPDVGLPMRNVLYSLQWLFLAGFAIVMWVKWFREDVADAWDSQADGVENRPAQVSLDA
jgi:cytochrome oxidase assembly protein ShyY1